MFATGVDLLTGLMLYRQSGTASLNANCQNIFEWNPNGNLRMRIDGSQPNRSETLFYDALSRLYYSKLNSVID